MANVEGKQKINVAILFGGKSVEHEGSVQSAKHIFLSIDKEKYNPILIGIDKDGKWSLYDHVFFSEETNLGLSCLSYCYINQVALIPGNCGKLILLSDLSEIKIDVVFPIWHGGFGEDGTLQGALRIMEIPFVGSCVLGSAIGMDKDITKRLLRDANILIGKFIVLKKTENNMDYNLIAKTLGLPFFVKPASLGSSVGVAKIKNENDFIAAINVGFKYCNKILAEEYILGREVECSIVGNYDLYASKIGEVISNPKYGYYSYDAKYRDQDGAILKVPVNLPKHLEKEIQMLAIKIFKLLECFGMARIDFFLTNDEKIFVNEINTIPGFTIESMYPSLCVASGINYTNLIDKLIMLAIEKFENEKNLVTKGIIS
jgi:D-alanine-D-alanine ligase